MTITVGAPRGFLPRDFEPLPRGSRFESEVPAAPGPPRERASDAIAASLPAEDRNIHHSASAPTNTRAIAPIKNQAIRLSLVRRSAAVGRARIRAPGVGVAIV